MKKNVLVFGLIAGLIVSLVLAGSIGWCLYTNEFKGSMWIGYTSMLVAFSFIFVGVRNFRDKENKGFISFGLAFKTGFFICLIASSMYVATWLIDYYFFIPDFMDRYAEHMMTASKTNGASAEELARQATEMESYKEMYKNPMFVILLTYAEILPVGLVVSLISALILKKKNPRLG